MRRNHFLYHSKRNNISPKGDPKAKLWLRTHPKEGIDGYFGQRNCTGCCRKELLAKFEWNIGKSRPLERQCKYK